jgi:hypothetical protein
VNATSKLTACASCRIFIAVLSFHAPSVQYRGCAFSLHHTSNMKSESFGSGSSWTVVHLSSVGLAQGEALRFMCERAGESQNYVPRQPAL